MIEARPNIVVMLNFDSPHSGKIRLIPFGIQITIAWL